MSSRWFQALYFDSTLKLVLIEKLPPHIVDSILNSESYEHN